MDLLEELFLRKIPFEVEYNGTMYVIRIIGHTGHGDSIQAALDSCFKSMEMDLPGVHSHRSVDKIEALYRSMYGID